MKLSENSALLAFPPLNSQELRKSLRSLQNENAQGQIDLFLKKLKEDLDKAVENIISKTKAKLTERRELLG